MLEKRFCYFIPLDANVSGHGFRVSIVTEKEPGHAPIGNWPYTGKQGEQMPWFWGETYEAACATAKEANKRLGLSEKDVAIIVASSMFAK